MGNSYCCQQYYQSLPCAPQTKRSNLRNKLSQYLTKSQFKEICLQTIERHYDDALELQTEEVLRHSVVAFNHYEINNLNHSLSDQLTNSMQSNQSGHTSSTMVGMPPEKRQRYLLKLIRQSYLFLDFSDCIDNRKSYDKLMRSQVIRADPSLGSFVGQNSPYIAHLEEELKNFNEDLVCRLQNYVRFCRKVKHDFTPDRQRFLSKLNLSLQSQIIRKYLNREFRKNTNTLDEMMQDIEEILRILILTVESMYDFRLDGQRLHLEEEFFNSLNIYTMITSILFESEDFAGFIINKIKDCFRHRFNAYRIGETYTVGDFITDFIALNSNDSRRQARINQRCSHLLSYSKYDSFPIFQRSQRILANLYGKSVPLFKLKVIFELTQQMAKEIQELRNTLKDKHGIDLGSVFTRETDLLAIKWLLRANSQSIDEISAHLIFTYHFVHRMHLVDRKGSYLITFMQEVERIVQWSRPSDGDLQ